MPQDLSGHRISVLPELPKLVRRVRLPLAAILLPVLLAGCASAPYASAPGPGPGIPGIYHRVSQGQTLWRISKMYGLELEELVRINRINDASSLEIGQLIFIPHRQKALSGAQRFSKSGEDFIWPLKGRALLNFGQTYNNMLNKGINIQPSSSDEVLAARSGRVVFYSGNFYGYGKTLIIDHQDGFSTVYARNSEVTVKPGQDVQKGQVIARVSLKPGHYLHFEIRKAGNSQNPNFYLPR